MVGGGVQVPGATSSSHVVASRPWDSKDSGTVPDDGWRAGILNEAPHSMELTVHAVCDQHASIF